MRLKEKVVECDSCGFAGLVGSRHQEYAPYQMAELQSHWVVFCFCTSCGVTHCEAEGRFGRQPAQLRVVGGKVTLSEWVPSVSSPFEQTDAVAESSPQRGFDPGICCSACGAAAVLLRTVETAAALHAVRCPTCWSGSLRLSDARATHLRW
jgi:hypothetical protein